MCLHPLRKEFSQKKGDYMTRFVEDIKKYSSYTFYSAKSELKSEIAGSHLSWLWWILDPLLFMLVYMFVALIVFGRGEQYFPIFIFFGLTTWQFFSKTIKGSVKLVSANSSVVSKVYLPKYLLVIQKMFNNGFKMIISLSIVLIMMIWFRVPLSLNVLYVVPLFIVLFLITFGISTLCMHFGVYVEDLANLITVGMQLLFYMSGIFYNIPERVPEPYATLLAKWNPIAYIITELRNVMLYSTQPDLKVLGIWFVIGLLLTVMGIRTIYKYENSYVKVI